MSFHDPFNVFVYRLNQCDDVPSKNLGKKLNHFTIILSLVPIEAFLYSLKNTSLKNTSRSSPLLPLKL
jgi:hypothetical protein